MADLDDLYTASAALVTTPMDATGITWSVAGDRVGRDYRVPAGEARAQTMVNLASKNNFGDANQTYYEAEVAITITYHATTAALQNTWTQTHLDAIVRALVDRSAWSGLVSVYQVAGGPEAGTPDKTGRVVFIEIAVRVQLAP